jgi:hypothetical protein
MICQNKYALSFGPEGYSNVGPCVRKATRTRWVAGLNLQTLKREKTLRHYCDECAQSYDEARAEARWEARVS